MGEKDWVIDVNDELKRMGDSSTEMEHWNKQSIYKIPARVKDLNKKAYKPQVVSLGPYHHDEKDLKPMENHKRRALLHLLKRSKKPLEDYVDALDQVVEDLKSSYDSLDPAWKRDTDKFLKMMVLDGCFILEILRTANQSLKDYAPKDPIFSDHGKVYFVPYVQRDMLMLENQLPMLVLNKLVAVEGTKAEHDDLFVERLILNFYDLDPDVPNMSKCLHILDVYRKSLLLGTCRLNTGIMNCPGPIIPCATELSEAGIRFRKCRSGSLRDISFNGGVLRLPFISIDDAVESMFLNQLAFERFHVGAGNEVTSYIIFMSNIVTNDRDVRLLRSKGIITNCIGSDTNVAKLFNSLGQDLTPDSINVSDMDHNLFHPAILQYYKMSWNKWCADLFRTHFKNPWAILAVIAAFALFGLTGLQTIYTIIAYYKSK